MTIKQIKIVLAAAVTWLVFAAVVLSAVAAQAPAVGPIGDTIARWALTGLVWISTAIAIIRRVTPVPVDERGILPRTRSRRPKTPANGA